MRFVLVMLLAMASACDTYNWTVAPLVGDGGLGDPLCVGGSDTMGLEGNLGSSEILPFSYPALGVRPPDVILAKVTAKQPTLLTVGFTIDPDSYPLGGVVPDGEVVGVLVFGAGGVAARAEVDISNGALITVLAGQVTASAYYQQLSGPPAVATQPRAGAFVVEGACARRAPQRTIGLMNSATIAVGASYPAAPAALAVPVFAKSFRVVLMPINAQAIIHMLRSDDLADVAAYPIVGVPSDEMPLPNSARWFRIENTGAVVITSARLVFDLDL